MASIILNADDFGYSDGICRSILELLDIGAVSGTSMMCAALGAADRFQHWHASHLLGLAGVHLQLTGGQPLSPAAEVPSLIDPISGHFRNPRVGPLPNPAEVVMEWRRQLDAAHLALGGPPTHLDSHHGVHRIPQFFEAYTGLASELGIPIRGTDGEFGSHMRTQGIRGTVALVRNWTGRSLGPESLRQMVGQVCIDRPEEKIIEVISHPGYNDDYLSSISSLSAAREDDHRALVELARAGWPGIDGHKLVTHASL